MLFVIFGCEQRGLQGKPREHDGFKSRRLKATYGSHLLQWIRKRRWNQRGRGWTKLLLGIHVLITLEVNCLHRPKSTVRKLMVLSSNGKKLKEIAEIPFLISQVGNYCSIYNEIAHCIPWCSLFAVDFIVTSHWYLVVDVFSTTFWMEPTEWYVGDWQIVK